MDLSAEAQNPFLAIFLTISVSIFNWIRWFSTTPLLIFAVLYLPIGVKLAQSQKEHSIFKYPLFGVLGIVSFQWLSLLLLFWSILVMFLLLKKDQKKLFHFNKHLHL